MECQAADKVVLTYACDRPATLEQLAQFILAPRAPATPGNATLHIRAGVRGVGLEFRSRAIDYFLGCTL